MNDSIWATVGSWAKWFGVGPREILDGLTWRNLLLYGASTPDYGGGGSAADGGSESAQDWDDPGALAGTELDWE